MNANELRIGNYVWEDYGGVYLVRGVSEKKIRISKTKTTISVHYKISEVDPIPLTEEWLLRFGFESRFLTISKVTEFYKRKLSVVIFKNEVKGTHIGMISIAVQRIDDGSKIKFVHQIQNLYFALTGEELILKP